VGKEIKQHFPAAFDTRFKTLVSASHCSTTNHQPPTTNHQPPTGTVFVADGVAVAESLALPLAATDS
jgi:hypothetical protein